jgi:putative endonuclease
MRDGKTLVFVEVKARTGSGFGGTAQAITAGKIAKLSATAQFYLSQMRPTPPCRFDAVLLQGKAPATIEWLQNIIDS